MANTCLHCGNPVGNENKDKFYCDMKCWWDAVGKPSRQKARKVFNRKCRHCTKEYATTDSRKMYCSNECKIDYCNKKRAVHKGKTGTCEVCGKEFVVKMNPTKRTCSNRCARFKCKYDGNRLKAIIRDNFTCQLCGKSKDQQFEVHHKDFTGQKENPNHDLSNLITLCVKCHRTLHAGFRKTGRVIQF